MGGRRGRSGKVIWEPGSMDSFLTSMEFSLISLLCFRMVSMWRARFRLKSRKGRRVFGCWLVTREGWVGQEQPPCTRERGSCTSLRERLEKRGREKKKMKGLRERVFK